MSDGVESSAAQDAEKLDHAEAVTSDATSIAGRKRPRRPDGELASRSKRMFGLLNQTLTKAKEDNTRGSTGEVVCGTRYFVYITYTICLGTQAGRNPSPAAGETKTR